jgi:hypothetical protein
VITWEVAILQTSSTFFFLVFSVRFGDDAEYEEKGEVPLGPTA